MLTQTKGSMSKFRWKACVIWTWKLPSACHTASFVTFLNDSLRFWSGGKYLRWVGAKAQYKSSILIPLYRTVFAHGPGSYVNGFHCQLPCMHFCLLWLHHMLRIQQRYEIQVFHYVIYLISWSPTSVIYWFSCSGSILKIIDSFLHFIRWILKFELAPRYLCKSKANWNGASQD